MIRDALPPANPNALGLHVTDAEWCRLRELLTVDSMIVRARIYGSRQTGIRRPKPKPEPLDIDLAIEVHVDDPSQAFHEFWAAQDRLLERAAGTLRIQVEDLTDMESPRYAARQAGVLILDRQSPNLMHRRPRGAGSG